MAQRVPGPGASSGQVERDPDRKLGLATRERVAGHLAELGAERHLRLLLARLGRLLAGSHQLHQRQLGKLERSLTT